MLRFLVRLSGVIVCTLCVVMSVVTAPNTYTSSEPQQREGAFREVLRYGRGVPTGIHWQPNGSIILVNSISGVWLYTDTLTDLHHFPDLRDASFSPDGQWILGKEDEKSAIYDAASFEGRFLEISQAAFSYDSRYIAGLDEQSALLVFELNTLDDVFKQDVLSFAWRPHSNQLAILNKGGRLSIFSLDPSQSLIQLEDVGTEGRILWSPDGQRILVDYPDNTIRIWNRLESKEASITIPHAAHIQRVFDEVTWHSNSRQVVRYYFLDEYSELHIYDAETGEQVATPPVGYLYNLSFSSDGAFFGASSGVFDAHTFERVIDFLSDSVLFSPDGKYVAYSRWFVADITVAETNSGNVLQTLTGVYLEERWSQQLVWSPDSQRLLSWDSSGLVVLWDVKTTKEIARVTSFIGNSQVAYSDNGLVAVSDRAGSVRIWNYSTGELVSTLTGHASEISQMAWQPNGDLLATITSGFMDSNYPKDSHNVRVWNTTTGELVETLGLEESGIVNSIVWHPDGEILGYSESYPEIRLWSPENGIQAPYPKKPDDVAVGATYIRWLPEADLVWMADYKGLDAWRISTRELLVKIWTGYDQYGYQWHSKSGKLYSTSASCDDDVLEHCSLSVGLVFDPRLPVPKQGVSLYDTLQTFKITGFSGKPLSFWTTDGARLAVSDHEKVEIWDIESQEKLFSYSYDDISHIFWGPLHNQIALKTSDNQSLIIDLRTGKALFPIDHLHHWSPQESMIVTFDGKISKVVDSATGDVLMTMQGLISAWSSDDQSYGTLSDGMFLLWSRE